MPKGGNEHHDGSLVHQVLRAVTRQVSTRPKITLALVAIVAVASIAFTWREIEFKTDRADLIDPTAPFHRRWIDYTKSFGDASDIIVVVEANGPATIQKVLEDLGTRLKQETDLLSNILYKIDPGPMRRKSLQCLSPAQLEAGLQQLAQYSPILQGQWNVLQLDSLVSRLQYQIESRWNSPNALKPLLKQADLLTASMAESLDDPNSFRSPWPDILPDDGWLRQPPEEPIYFLNEKGNIGFLKAAPTQQATDFSGNSESISRLRQVIDDVAQKYPFAKIGVTGIPVLESDEMSRSQSDMLTASVVSMVGVGLLLFLGFRGFRHPLLALLMLIVGIAWSFGYTTLAIGHLNILSVSFTVILIGLGIDFAIHFLARYLDLRHNGESIEPALVSTSGSVGVGIVTAAVTTAFAFFCATFTRFLGIAELGIIVGGGILLCAAATFIVLPALLSLGDRNIKPRKLHSPFEGSWLRTATARFPLILFLASLAAITGVGSRALIYDDGHLESRISYDYNLLNLQAEGSESVDIQKRVFGESRKSLLYAVSVASSVDEARQLHREFEKLESVDHVEDLASRLPAYPLSQTQLYIQAYQARLARLPRHPPRIPAPNPTRVGRALEKFFLRIKTREDPLSKRIAKSVDKFLDQFETLPLKQQSMFLKEFHGRLVGDLWAQFRGVSGATETEPLQFAELPAELTSRFLSPNGQWLVQIYPKEQIWDVEPLSRFVSDVRSVDPNATGTPLQNFEAAREIKESYLTASLYALSLICLVLLIDFLGRDHKLIALLPPLAVVGFVAMAMHTRRVDFNPVVLVTTYVGMVAAIGALLDFRNLRDALLAMIPPVTGGVLMFGVLGILSIDLNPANLIVLPLVLGIGVDDGVHVIHDFRFQKKGHYETASSTINAIVLTSLTSMIGFGSLMLAAHRGLYSVGLVLVVGVGSCLFVSLVTLPAILTLIDRRSTKTVKSANRPETRSSAQRPQKQSAKAA